MKHLEYAILICYIQFALTPVPSPAFETDVAQAKTSVSQSETHCSYAKESEWLNNWYTRAKSKQDFFGVSGACAHLAFFEESCGNLEEAQSRCTEGLSNLNKAATTNRVEECEKLRVRLLELRGDVETRRNDFSSAAADLEESLILARKLKETNLIPLIEKELNFVLFCSNRPAGVKNATLAPLQQCEEIKKDGQK